MISKKLEVLVTLTRDDLNLWALYANQTRWLILSVNWPISSFHLGSVVWVLVFQIKIFRQSCNNELPIYASSHINNFKTESHWRWQSALEGSLSHQNYKHTFCKILSQAILADIPLNFQLSRWNISQVVLELRGKSTVLLHYYLSNLRWLTEVKQFQCQWVNQ